MLSEALAAPLPVGRSDLTIEVRGVSLTAYAYKPEGYAGRGLLLVLHGVGRNAQGYRDYAVPIAERHGWLVVAPLFDRKRFPTWRYQWGGVVRSPAETGPLQALPESEWAGALILGIVEAVRTLEAAPALPYALLGHSGGAQALSRVAALTNTGAQRIVLANAGTYLWPSREARFPDGFGGLPASLDNDDVLRAYLAQPITFLLGTADVLQDADLSTRASAVAQGANRYERGHNLYAQARRLAQSRGWPFNWKLVEVPGVGHSARRMFGASEAVEALDLLTSR